MKTGYSLLCYNAFKWYDLSTYLAAIIRFFDNLWHKANGKVYCKYSHSAMIIEEDGDLWIYEAIEKGYEKSCTIEDFIRNWGRDNLLLLRPKFTYDESLIKTTARKLEGIKYNFGGLVQEAVYLTSNERIWLGKKKEINKTFCTEATAYCYYIASDNMVLPNYTTINPYDLFNSELFYKELL